jgi:hypothetical protein
LLEGNFYHRGISEQDRERLHGLDIKTLAVESELRTRKLIAIVEKKLEKARLELFKASKTRTQRREQDADMERIALHYSDAYPDLHPDWRSRAQETFDKRTLS